MGAAPINLQEYSPEMTTDRVIKKTDFFIHRSGLDGGEGRNSVV